MPYRVAPIVLRAPIFATLFNDCHGNEPRYIECRHENNQRKDE